MNFVPAHPGWLVQFSDGTSSPVVAWQIISDGLQYQALPITTEMAAVHVFKLIPPSNANVPPV